MKNKNKVTVAILTYNNADVIGSVIDAIESQTYKYFEIVIVDNNSTDQTCNTILSKRHFHKNIAFFKNEKNLGYNIGKNMAVEKSQTDYIYLIDGDIRLTNPNTLLELVSFYEKTSNIAFCSIPLRNYGDMLVAHTGCFFSWYGQRLNKKLKIDVLRALHCYPTGAPIGGNIFFEKKIWNKLGGYIDIQPFNFDDYYIGGLSYILGYKNYIYSNLIADHLGKNRNTTESFSRKFRYFLSGNLFVINIIYKRNILYSFLASIFIFFKALKNSFKFKSLKPMSSYFFSMSYFFRQLDFTLKMRKKIQRNRLVNEDYFLMISPPQT